MPVTTDYVEAKKPPDITTVREVVEEVGADIETPTYVAARPRPSGHSQMADYRAHTALSRPTPQADGMEVEWARFCGRDELTRALDNGEINASGRTSIAYVLPREWHDEELPSDPDGAGHD